MAQRSTATDYGKWAEQQRKTARWWSLTAILLFIFAAVAFLESTFHFFTSPSTLVSSGSPWEEFFARLGMTGVALAGALYAAKESGQHKKEERRAKARELVLTTMDPFMANIDKDVRELIRTEAARSIFVLPRDKEEESQDKDHTIHGQLLKHLQPRKQAKEDENE